GVFPLLAHSTPQVEITQTLHFDDPEGKAVQIPAGTYGVILSEGQHLLLSQPEKETLVVQTQKGDHAESIAEPEALLLPDETDSTMVSVVLLLPDGTGWEAVGSTTGIQGRGKIRLSRVLRSRIPKRPLSPKPPVPPTLPPAIPVPSDCPVVVPYTIVGFPSGVTDPTAAPNGTQIIGDLVAEILKSYRPGCWPIKTILITGHSDKSPGGIQVDDYISVQRAVDAKKVLQQEFATRAAGMSIPPGYPSPAEMNFIVGGIGARELDPSGPAQQPENRRVDFLSYQLPVTIEESTTRAGGDFEQHMAPNYQSCRARCASTLNCRAYTYKKPVLPQTEGQCSLKKSGSRPSRDPKAISGVVLPTP
ncbi:MAG: PAN domain-containing protein, partial [Nitrospirota bacterium]|nr:PAN domain-containing protein [Nitrospirota bacterium]